MKNFHLCIIAATAAVALAALLQSCNVTRTVTTQSQYIQRGDTAVVIETKTVEIYDATEKL